MKNPKLSPLFTIDDIHKIRKYNDYLIKDMNDEEMIDFFNYGKEELKKEFTCKGNLK